MFRASSGQLTNHGCNHLLSRTFYYGPDVSVPADHRIPMALSLPRAEGKRQHFLLLFASLSFAIHPA